MATTTAARSQTTSLVSWEKAQQQAKTQNKKNNPLLGFGIAAVILLALAGMWRLAHQKPSVQWVQVIAAKRDIPAGTRLSFGTVSFFNVPKQFYSPEMIINLNDATSRVARTFIPAGEPLQKYMFFPGNRGMSAALETHERAMTLQLSDDALVDHAIELDDRVDIIVTSSHKGKKYTKTICQAVRVLMTSPKEQVLARGISVPTNKITLAILPDQTEIITEAVETGKISLVLRSRLSRVEQHLHGAAPEDILPAVALLPDDNPPPAKLSTNAIIIPPPPSNAPDAAIGPTTENNGPLQWMVEVIMGNKKESYGVPEK